MNYNCVFGIHTYQKQAQLQVRHLKYLWHQPHVVGVRQAESSFFHP
jgi:hypothetical protein